MKILMLIDLLDVGGAETHVEVLATELVSLGHEIIVASARGQTFEKLKRTKIRCIPLPSQLKNEGKSSNFDFFLHYLPFKYTISRLINQIKPDLVHAHTRRTAFVVHSICKMHKIPLVVTAHSLFSMKFPKNFLSKWGDGTIAVSEDIKNHILKHKNTVLNIKTIPNGVEIPREATSNTQKT